MKIFNHFALKNIITNVKKFQNKWLKKLKQSIISNILKKLLKYYNQNIKNHVNIRMIWRLIFVVFLKIKKFIYSNLEKKVSDFHHWHLTKSFVWIMTNKMTISFSVNKTNSLRTNIILAITKINDEVCSIVVMKNLMCLFFILSNKLIFQSECRVAASDRKSDGSIFGRKSDPIAEAEAKNFENPIRFSPIRQYASLIELKRIGSDAIFNFFIGLDRIHFYFFVESEDKNCFRSDPMVTLSECEWFDKKMINSALNKTMICSKRFENEHDYSFHKDAKRSAKAAELTKMKIQILKWWNSTVYKMYVNKKIFQRFDMFRRFQKTCSKIV